MKRYNPTEIEAKWQKTWLDNKTYEVKDDDPRPKYYYLVEFPYPSGVGLHVGHCRPYITFDIMSRWRRMTGENVLFPMGWDSFGLPAEQYALKTGVHPSKTTIANINNFRQQAQRLGLSFDWSREFSTSDPSYYKWTQWILINLFKHNLAYQAETSVWWCEELKSVLADEEVIDGRSERGDFVCERRPLRQWMLAITKYADRLYDDLEDVDYIEPVKVQQRNWIGRSRGAEVKFDVADSQGLSISVFTTRIDTLFGATYLVLAPENRLVSQITTPSQDMEVKKYVEATASKSELTRQETVKDKTGVFTGAYAMNPINQQKIPIWISDYVLMNYGTGAIMAVPAHDERDWEFAEKFGLPVIRVVKNDEAEDSYSEAEGTMINSGPYDGLASALAREKITADLVKKNLANEITNFKLRDWVFSRQRYWGEPFPIVWVRKEDASGVSGSVAEWSPSKPVTKVVDGVDYEAMPVPPKFLPVELPDVKDFQPKGLGKGPLAENKDWVEVWFNLDSGEMVSRSELKPEGEHWAAGQRETDTMPNWAGSSWYFLRYLDPRNDQEFASRQKIDQWMAVDWYNGGMEHTTLHLLYSRFWYKFLFDLGLVNTSEPYKKRTSHGLVLYGDGKKMSKSLGNVVDPIVVANDYGADTLRLYVAFIGPFEQSVVWNVNGVAGCRRFIERFWRLAFEFKDSVDVVNEQSKIKNKELAQVIARANQKISTDIPRLGFNTAVATLMETINSLYKLKDKLPFKDNAADWSNAFRELIIISSPFMPHLCEEIWQEFGMSGSVLSVTWPMWDEAALISDKTKIAVQVNGKLRAEIEVNLDEQEEEIVSIAKKEPKVSEQVQGKEIQRVVYISNRLLNIVTN